jgi:hypothetical protein
LSGEDPVPDEAVAPTVNLALVRGVASGPPELRTLASGRRLATFAVKTHALEPPATSVAVAVWDPPAWLEAIDRGDELVVTGCLRRRFYPSVTGALAARVELEASLVGRGSDARKLQRVRCLAQETLENIE